jgi:predicted acyltransferase
MPTTAQEAPVRVSRKAPAPVERSTTTERCLSLDAYRGFVMLMMVSSGLSLGHLMTANLPPSLPNKVLLVAADQLRHREWDMTFGVNAGFPWWDTQFHDGTGCTPWDLIQPSFMFIVGAAMPFAFARRRERGESWGRQFIHAIRRALLLIVVGVFLDVYGDRLFEVQMIRVLQQIAVGYFLAFLVLGLPPWSQALTAVLILVAHTAAFLIYGWATGAYPWVLTPDPSWTQEQIILWQQTHNFGWAMDEGMYQVFSLWGRCPTIMPHPRGYYAQINALSSTATILFGVLAGELLRRRWSEGRKLLILTVAGVAGIVLGLALAAVIPINKKIWTASFTLFSGGCTSLLLVAFYGIIDVIQLRRWTFPLVVVGMNSIAIYVMAGTVAGGIRRAWQAFLGWPLGEKPGLAGPVIDASQALFAWPTNPAAELAAPVLLAVLTVAVEWLFCYWLYKRRIFFKV